jgi:uncharacterized membrane protein
MGKRIKKFANLIADSLEDSLLIIIGAFAGAFLGAYFPKTEMNLNWNIILWGTFILVFLCLLFIKWVSSTNKKPSK